eukprot:scaffold24879_cov79-Skeletonema_dohrnii-CCMP3373.AAC.1
MPRDQVTNETKRDKRQSFMFMNDVRRTFGNATTLPSKEEVILPTIEEETAEEIYAICWMILRITLHAWKR